MMTDATARHEPRHDDTAGPRAIGWPRRIAAFAGALLVAAAWGSIVQTQSNLQVLAPFASAPVALRALTTLQDLAGFGPNYAGIVLAAWLPAFPVAWALARAVPRARGGLYAAAGMAGIVVAIRSVDAVAPMPVLIDATRSTAGLLAMAAGGALGGGLFARWTRAPARR